MAPSSDASAAAMYDLAHACPVCRIVTIFSSDAPYPRRCGRCERVVREAPSASRFVARPLLDAHDDDLDRFELELGPAVIESAPF